MKRICQKAANGNVYNDVKKNKIKIKTFHLMKDKEDKSKRYLRELGPNSLIFRKNRISNLSHFDSNGTVK